MKNERLLDVLEKIDEDLIAEAAPGNKPPKKSNSVVWMKWGTMAACALVIVGIGVPQILRDRGVSGGPEDILLEGNISDEGLPEEGVILEGEHPVSDTTSSITEEQSAMEEAAPQVKEELEAEMPLAQGYFNATVLNISDEYMMVSCTDSQLSDIEEGTVIRVSLNTISSEPIPELVVGANVRVLFIGDVIVTEEYVQTEKTVSIFLLDENNEVIVQ